jgi:hypothetical protein
MAMQLELVGGRFVAAMALLLAVAGNAAFAQEHKTYRCKVVDVVHVGEDGRLRLDSNPKDMVRYLYDGVVVNTLTGAVTYPDGNRVVWNVVQRGREKDYVLTRPTVPGLPLEQIWASEVTDFIRIRTWNEQPTVRLLVFGLNSLASGFCEVAR